MNGEHDSERDMGEQPLAQILKTHNLSVHDLVAVSTEQLTHKMVARAIKGRRLTPNTKRKVLNAINAAANKLYRLEDIFNYR